MEKVDVIFKAGRSAVDLALFTMLPIMVVMLSLMRILEARGLLDRFVKSITVVTRPFGLNGLSVFAAMQINFVGGAAPVAALAMMEQRGASDRHLATTLAMVFAMAPGNVAFTMVAMGVHFGYALLWSITGGLVAAAVTFHLFGKRLSDQEAHVDESLHHPVAENMKGILDVVNRAGGDAFKIAVGAIPMLVLSLVAITIMKELGFIDWLTVQLTPLLAAVNMDPALILPTLTKYLAGATAMMGVMDEMRRNGQVDVDLISKSAGWLIHPLDLPGLAILTTAGRRVASVWRPAAVGACAGIAVRTVGHILVG